MFGCINYEAISMQHVISLFLCLSLLLYLITYACFFMAQSIASLRLLLASKEGRVAGGSRQQRTVHGSVYETERPRCEF